MLKMREQEAKTPGIYQSEQNDDSDVNVHKQVQLNSNKHCHKK